MSQQTNNPEENNKQPLEITPEDIRAEVLKNIKAHEEQEGAFIFKNANAWLEEASKEPIPNMLFDVLWNEGELCILFADTNVGKSILAVQIGDSISCGCPIPGFALEAPAQPILYFDFELNKKQFENRYSANYEDHHVFCDNFTRVALDPKAPRPEGMSFQEYICVSIERLVKRTGAKVLIVDNITYLGTDHEKAKEATTLMQQLQGLKELHKLSILVLAHTPKRDATRPLTENDVQGSAMIGNFIDTAFAIGKSHRDKTLRYLKQIKERSTAKIYGSDNVCICRLEKPHNFLRFELIGHDDEDAHLRKPNDDRKEELESRVLELHKEGKSLRQIGEELGVSHVKAMRVLKRAESNG